MLGKAFPVVGGRCRILAGMVIALFYRERNSTKAGITYTSKKVLQYAVILLGFGMNLSEIAKVGMTSLPIILSTISTSLIVAYLLYRFMHMPANISTLVGWAPPSAADLPSPPRPRSLGRTTRRSPSPSR